ncbi:MAG: hypothetical protein AAGG48_02955 [Planctomycetota bacterium]
MARKKPMTGTIAPAASTPAPPPIGSTQTAEAKPPKQARRQAKPDVEDDSRRSLRDDPRFAVLASTIFHTLLLLLLALFTLRVGSRNADSITARQGDASQVVTLDAVDAEDWSDNPQASAEQPVAVEIGMANVTPTQSPVASQTVEDVPELQELGSTAGSIQPATIIRLPGGGLAGRSAEGRIKYGELYGATPESEAAVDMALEWLARHQRPDGSWSFNLDLDPCNGQCRHSKKSGSDTPTPSTGATGLALLAFLGAGHTHRDPGPYQENVRAGIYYLRSIAGESASGYDWQQGSMYGHGIAVMALAEALALSAERTGQRESDLFDLVSRGAAFTCVAQHSSGAWGYVPGSPGDTTVTGWQVLSLIAAKRSDVPLQTDSLRNAKAFIQSTAGERKYWFGYKGPPGEPTTTAIGLTLMLYLGESPDYTPFYNALTDLANRGPTLTNIYHDYYGTLALHHSRHHGWDRWNNKLRDHLVATQETEGHERGSWHFSDRWGDVGGRLYTTAMCAMTLEVYYRYLPLYDSLDEFPL